MMKKYSIQDARAIINGICGAAGAGEFETRESFMNMLDKNPHIAVQGYNRFGKIFFWNEASAYLYNVRESDAISQDLFELVIPPEMRKFARDAVHVATRSGKMPDPGPCDLLRGGTEYVTVYSGHLVFQWDHATTPEFYCIDLELDTEVAESA